MTYLMFVPNITECRITSQSQLFGFMPDNDWQCVRIDDEVVAEPNETYSKSCYMFELYLIRSGIVPP